MSKMQQARGLDEIEQVWNVLNNNQLDTFELYNVHIDIAFVSTTELLKYRNQTKFKEFIRWDKESYIENLIRRNIN